MRDAFQAGLAAPQMSPLMTSRVLLVAGAVSHDYLIYPMMPPGDDGTSPRAEERLTDDEDAAQLVIRTGGADLVAQLLTAVAPQHGLQVLGPVLQSTATSRLMHNASSIVDLGCGNIYSGDPPIYQVLRLRHIGKSPPWNAPPLEQAAASTGPTVVITGSGERFRSVEPALDFLSRVRARYIVYNMASPLAVGPLWDLIRDGPRTRDGIPDPDFLAVIIDADDLRKEGIALSQSLSWEATAEDFVRNLGSNGRLDTLVTCPNLIVRFGTEGYIHHRGREAVDPKLWYHPRKTERDSQSGRQTQMVSFRKCCTATREQLTHMYAFADWACVRIYRWLRNGIRGQQTAGQR